MKDIITVAKFTIKDMITRKSFIVSSIIILALIVIGFNIPNILNSFGTEESTLNKMLIVDSENIFKGNLEALNQMQLGYEFQIQTQEITEEEIKQKIASEEVNSAIVLSAEGDKLQAEYIVKELGMGSTIPTTCEEALSSIYQTMQLQELGLSQAQIQSLNPNFEWEIKQVENKEVKGNIVVTMLLSIVLFYAIYFCAYQVSSSITTEKTSKIIETLVTTTKPRTIILGKTIGIGIVGLIQVCVIVLVALVSAKLFLPEGMLESVLDLSQITVGLGIITIVYFLLGYGVYSLLYAVTGSTVSKPEDIQSANTPVAILAVIGFYLAYFTMMNPTSNLNVFASIFPFSSPFCMPFRVMMGVAMPWEIVTSIIVLIVSMLIIAKISIKIYSSAILNTGSRISWKEMVKIYKQKDND